MSTCFVIQPFDKGRFDKRFDDVFAPAIEAAGLEAYRVDRDPSVDVPIDNIESGIREALACLADITTDNPNVWFELGFAIAARKDVVLVCSTERTTRFPFDIQHRNIVQYSPESASDFQKLGADITARLKAIQSKQADLKVFSLLPSPLKDTMGLAPHEVVALAVIMQNSLLPGQVVFPKQIAQDMGKAGFNELAASLALRGLLHKSMITLDIIDELSRGYVIAQKGIDWLHSNQSRVALEKPQRDDFPF